MPSCDFFGSTSECTCSDCAGGGAGVSVYWAKLNAATKAILRRGCAECGGVATRVYGDISYDDLVDSYLNGYCDSCWSMFSAEMRSAADISVAQAETVWKQATKLREEERYGMIREFYKVQLPEQLVPIRELLDSEIEFRKAYTENIKRTIQLELWDKSETKTLYMEKFVPCPWRYLRIKKINGRWVYCRNSEQRFIELGLHNYFELNLMKLVNTELKNELLNLGREAGERLLPIKELLKTEHSAGCTTKLLAERKFRRLQVPRQFLRIDKVKNRWVYCANKRELLCASGICKYFEVWDPRKC